MSRPLWKVSVTTTPEAEEAVAELLGEVFFAKHFILYQRPHPSNYGRGLFGKETQLARSEDNSS